MNRTNPSGHPDADHASAVLDVHRHLDLDEVLAAVVRHVGEWADADTAVVYRANVAGTVFTPRFAYPQDHSVRIKHLVDVEPQRVAAALSGGAGQAAVEDLEPFLTSAEAWPGGSPSGARLLAVRSDGEAPAAVVLLVGGDVAGRPVGDVVRRFLDEIRPAVANSIRVEAMKDLIIKDDTADCFNRRHFEESLPEELSRAARYRSPLSLIFFDLDNLKEVNSRHGHAMGSRTLFEVSVRVRSKIRKFDKLFRFGGDEFCILLPETEWHGAQEVAERVRESIADLPFLRGRIEDPEGIRVTASFGIASFPLHARTKDDMVVQADRAMQRIKTSTKNSIAIAEILGDDDES